MYYTSSRFKEQGFTFLQNAVNNFLQLPDQFIEETPIEYNMGGRYIERSKDLSKKSYNAIIATLNLIRNSRNFEEYENTDSFIWFREYDNKARRDMEEFLRKCVDKSKEYKSEFDAQLMYDIFKVNFREFTYDWYYKHFNIVIYQGNIPLNSESPFVQVLLAFLQEIFNGSRGVGKNDFNDLMHLLYLDSKYYYNTYEKNWINYLKSLPSTKHILIS